MAFEKKPAKSWRAPAEVSDILRPRSLAPNFSGVAAAHGVILGPAASPGSL